LEEPNLKGGRKLYFSYLTLSQAALPHIARNTDFWHAFLIIMVREAYSTVTSIFCATNPAFERRDGLSKI